MTYNEDDSPIRSVSPLVGDETGSDCIFNLGLS